MSEQMYLDDPPKPLTYWEPDPEDVVIGFMIPWYLRKLTPLIDSCHLKALEIKYLFSFRKYCVMSKFRIIPNSEREDYTSDVLYMDDEDQDKWVRKIQEGDIYRNGLYARAFAILMIIPMPYIIVRVYIRWFDILESFCLLSLIISAAGIPVVRTDRFELEMPGRWKMRAIYCNLYLAAAIAIVSALFPVGMSTWGLKESNKYWTSDGVLFGLMPFISAIISHIARRMMEAINYLEMEHVRYMYLRAYRWEEIGIEAANTEKLQAEGD